MKEQKYTQKASVLYSATGGDQEKVYLRCARNTTNIGQLSAHRLEIVARKILAIKVTSGNLLTKETLLF